MAGVVVWGLEMLGVRSRSLLRLLKCREALVGSCQSKRVRVIAKGSKGLGKCVADSREL